MRKFTFLTFMLTLIGWSNVANAQWTEQTSGTTNSLNSVYFIDANTGYAAGKGIIIKTTDGGANWATQSGTSGEFKSVYFINANTGMVAGGSGKIYRTTNGGTNWVNQTSVDLETNTFGSIYFFDANLGFVCGSYGSFIKTTDGGANWIQISNGTYDSFFAFYFTDANTGFAIKENGQISKTTNGGTNWAVKSGSTTYPYPLTSFCFIDSTTVYAVEVNGTGGTDGTIVKTTDGGINWITLTSGTTQQLKSLFFTNINIGYAVGESYVGAESVILKTSDGGINWETQTSGTTQPLRSIYIADNTGYVVGGKPYSPQTNIILKNTNLGTSIENLDLYNNNHLNIYPNPTNGKVSFNGTMNLVEIYNTLGTKVKQQQINTTEIDLSNSPKGIYFVIITDGAKTYTNKIIVE